MNAVSGWKTYIAAIGLTGLALYQLCGGDFERGFQSILAALVAAGLRHAISKQDEPSIKAWKPAILLALLLFPAPALAECVCPPGYCHCPGGACPAGCPGGICQPRVGEERSYVPQQFRKGSVEECTVLLSASNVSGSGVLIDKSGDTYLVATAAHVLEGRQRMAAAFPDGRHAEASFLWADPTADVGFLTIRSRETYTITGVASADPAAGTPIWKVGYPSGHLNTLQGTTLNPNGSTFFGRVTVRPGDSGGGLFDGQGRLVGIATGYRTDNPSVAIGVTAARVRVAIGSACWPRCTQPRPRVNVEVNPAPAPTPPVVVAPPNDDITALRKDVADLSALLASKQSLPGPPGPQGPQGPAGPQGPVGPAGAAIDPGRLLAIEQRLIALEKAQGPTRVRVEPIPPK